ncbi:hypothetical protein E2C01_093825 [Portunus trituberculatus]|uniref:Uncharacterized protein n=1 Tax=Portunus trituberculatus TaxID=210409 RepID=A0A5B7K1F1_PORTR|nr:hypothetical protein [Portunus trituberculatus]
MYLIVGKEALGSSVLPGQPAAFPFLNRRPQAICVGAPKEEGQPRPKKESYKKAHLSAGSLKSVKSAKTVSQN